MSDDERRRKQRERMAKWKAANPERAKAIQRDYYYRHRDKRINDERQRTKRRQARLEEMLASQGGICYLCGQPLSGEDAHVDHWHGCCTTSRNSHGCPRCIRGVAHGQCNMIIGLAHENPDLLRRVADALESANERMGKDQQDYLWR